MRTWRLGDPEPSDRPPIVDDDSIIWLREETEEGMWIQQGVSIDGNRGEGPRELLWDELLTEFGPLTEVPEDVQTA